MAQLMLDIALLYRKFPVLQRDPIQRTRVSKLLQEAPPISANRYDESEKFLLPLLQCERCIATRIGKILKVAKTDLPIEFFSMLKEHFIESPPWESTDIDRGMATSDQLPEESVIVRWVLAFVPLCPVEIASGTTMKVECEELCKRFEKFGQSIFDGCTTATAGRLRTNPEELIALAASINMDTTELNSAKQYCKSYMSSLVDEHGGRSMLACKLLTKNNHVDNWAKYSRSDKQDIDPKIPPSVVMSRTKEIEWIRRDLILGQSSVENAPFAAEVATAVVDHLVGDKEYKSYIRMTSDLGGCLSPPPEDDMRKRAAWILVARLIAYGVIPAHTASLPDISGLKKLVEFNNGKAPIESQYKFFPNGGQVTCFDMTMKMKIHEGLDAFFGKGGSVDQLQFYKAFLAVGHTSKSDAKTSGDMTPSTDAEGPPRELLSFEDVLARATAEMQFWPQVERNMENFTRHSEALVNKDRANCLRLACELTRIGSSLQEALDLVQLSLKSRGDGRQLGSFEDHLAWAVEFLEGGRRMHDVLIAKELAHCIADVDFQGEFGPGGDDIEYTRFDVAVDWLQFGFPIEALQVECTFGKHLSRLKDKLTAAYEVNTCVICFQGLPKAQCAGSGCSKNHNKFHKGCIKKWFDGGKRTCPLCREAV